MRPAPRQTGRILVVEDDRKTAASLRLYLEHAGFEVSTAFTGGEALRQARETEPDLLLLDAMLPEVDGFAICRALRAERDVPVILVTARSTEEDKLEGLALGADDYVTKPFSPREVVARVRAVLRRARRPEQAPVRIRTRQIEIDVETHTAAVRGQPVNLTPAEFELLAARTRPGPSPFPRRPDRARVRSGLRGSREDARCSCHAPSAKDRISRAAAPPGNDLRRRLQARRSFPVSACTA